MGPGSTVSTWQNWDLNAYHPVPPSTCCCTEVLFTGASSEEPHHWEPESRQRGPVRVRLLVWTLTAGGHAAHSSVALDKLLNLSGPQSLHSRQ
jgi:hypothetical protein